MSSECKDRLNAALHDAKLIEMNMRVKPTSLTYGELIDLTQSQAMIIVKNLQFIAESEAN